MDKKEWLEIKDQYAKIFEDPEQWDKALQSIKPSELWCDIQHE